MKISVTYNETELARLLEQIINHPNSSEFVKLFTPLLCESHLASEYFFKIFLGDKLPDIIPNGTLCKAPIEQLGFLSNKSLIKNKFADETGKIIVKIKAFNGFHQYCEYRIEYQNVLSNGTTETKETVISSDHLEIFEEF